jgi:hypothetical protein
LWEQTLLFWGEDYRERLAGEGSIQGERYNSVPLARDLTGDTLKVVESRLGYKHNRTCVTETGHDKSLKPDSNWG